MNKLKRNSKKVAIGVIGGLVVVIGLILVPYPGPGWLVVFGGLAILGSEFEFASRLLDFARKKYDIWADWIKAQNWFVRIVAVTLTCAVVLTTLWLMNAFGILISLAELDIPWLTSPIFR